VSLNAGKRPQFPVELQVILNQEVWKVAPDGEDNFLMQGTLLTMVGSF
jgi:hypothetical protein